MLTGAIVLLVVGLSSVDASAARAVSLYQSGNWIDQPGDVNDKEQTYTFYSDVQFIIRDTGNGGTFGPFRDNYDMTNTNGTVCGCISGDTNKFTLKKGTYKIKTWWDGAVKLSVSKQVTNGYRLFSDGNKMINGVQNVDKHNDTYLFDSSNPLRLNVTGTTQFKVCKYENGNETIYSAWNGSNDQGHKDGVYSFFWDGKDTGTYDCPNNGGYFSLPNGSYVIWMDGSKLHVDKVSSTTSNPTLYLYKKSSDNEYTKIGSLSRVANTDDYVISTTSYTDWGGVFVLATNNVDKSDWNGLKSTMYGNSIADFEFKDAVGGTEAISQKEACFKFRYGAIPTIITAHWNRATNQYDKLSVEYKNEYYLSGDFNNWKNNTNGLGSADEFEPYKFIPATEKFGANTNWLMVKIKGQQDGMPENKSGKFHGQFQIYTKAVMDKYTRWASPEFRSLKNSDGTDQKDGDAVKPNPEYWEFPLPDNPTDSEIGALPALGYSENMRSNMHLKHNYYQNATVYFNPKTNQCFIEGQPQDIYVYYYNQAEVGETRDEKITVDQNQLNSVNYSVNPKITGASFETYHIPVDGMIPISTREGETVKVSHPALKDLKDNDVIRARVAPGLEESYKTQDGTFYYAFKLTGAELINENESFAFDGEDIFFINYNLAAITLNLIDANDADVWIDAKLAEGTQYEKKVLDHIKYRLIAIDGTKGPRYVTEKAVVVTEGDETTQEYRTSDPAKAWIFDMNKHLKHGEKDFAPVDAEGNVYSTEDGNHIHWNGINKKAEKASIAALADAPTETTPAWVQESETVPLAHSNRYVEIEVKFADLDGVPTPVQYISDFNREPVYDNNNQETGEVKLIPKGTQDFKLDGTHKYFAHKFDNITTGIKDIEVEGNVDGNAEAVYYTLQGVKTEKPVKGQIYIVVRGNKSSKVVY